MKTKAFHLVTFAILVLLCGGLFACTTTTTEATNETFMVTFSKNITDVTVSNMPSPMNVASNDLITRPSVDPSTTLYEFTGWYVDAACTTLFDFTTMRITGRQTIYAGWSFIITYYDVTFDPNYPQAVATTEEVESGDTVEAPTDPIREGYNFISWSTNANSEYVFDFANPITADLTLYAMWEAIYSLTYEFNAEGFETVVEHYGATESTVRPTDPTRTDFSFGGWFTDSLCTTAYTHGSKLTANVTLYAKWVRTAFNVTFDLNYSGSTPIMIKAQVNSDVPNPEIPTREGYVFTNWFTSPTEQTDEFLFDFSPVSDNETVVYAGWNQLFTVTFALNYPDAPDPTTQIVENGSQFDEFVPERTGYNFSGWFTDAECQNIYAAESVNGNITLYAAWTDINQPHDSFTVTYDLNYTGSEPVLVTVDSGACPLPPADPTRTGYRFSGWVTTPTGSTTYRCVPVTSNLTVYARWTNVWTITFNLDYEGASDPLIIETLNGTRISKPQNPVREGLWKFVTWNDEFGVPFIFTTVIQKNYQLHAVWARSGYNVMWDFNFSGEPVPVSMVVSVGTLAREPEKPFREGNWAIVGWFSDETCTIPYSLSSEVTSDVTLYAKWASGFAYRLDLNYLGAPNIPTQVISQGGMIPSRPVDPLRAGYTFVGWASTTNGNPDYTGFGSVIPGDITLYAQWQHTFVFETEYVDLDGKQGGGWSGGAAGTAMIVRDTITDDLELGTNANASNGYFLSYLYANGLFIDFVITSDRATEATLILRFSGEQLDPLTFTDDEYLITLNGSKVNYGSITINGTFAALRQRKLPFSDVISIPISLTEGVNLIRFTTNNQNVMGGTMEATAPLFDCIKIDTVAALSWNPKLSNLE